MLPITRKIVSTSKYSIKCPYSMDYQYVTIHNTANDASAASEISYMSGNNKETSYHFAVDDIAIIQAIELNRNAWHAGDGGNGKGNRKSVGIEICYSKSGGTRFTKAVDNAAQLAAYLLKQKGFGIDRLRKHQDWSGKYCPHRILSDYDWQWFVNLVTQYYNGQTPNITITPTVSPTIQSSSKQINVTYQVWDDIKNTWLPNVTNTSDFAGIFGHDICAIYTNLSEGNIYYKVHEVNGNWLPEVKNRTDYAGRFNKPIDAIMMKTDTGCKIHYKVHIRGGSWLGDVTGYDANENNNGYAGIIGKPIDGLQIWLEPKVSEVPKVVQPYGYLEHVNQNEISGWAYNGQNDNAVEVHLYFAKKGKDVKSYGNIQANIVREDLKQAGIGNGAHGFCFKHNFYKDLGEGEFTVRAYAIGRNNPQLNQTFTFNITKPNEIYRVRKSANDTSSQIGAYSKLDNAILKADEYKMNVYNNEGQMVWEYKAPAPVQPEVKSEPIPEPTPEPISEPISEPTPEPTPEPIPEVIEDKQEVIEDKQEVIVKPEIEVPIKPQQPNQTATNILIVIIKAIAQLLKKLFKK